jgi:TolB-like protein
MFKKMVVLFVVFLALVANHTVFSQAVAIDTALANATKEITESVPKGTKIAVLNISSDYGSLSDYIIDELIVNLVNTRSFQVVPRSTVELALARREFAFQMSGDVSDDSQKRLGQFLGAEAIVSGSITRDSANSYRLVVNAINLESFIYQTSYRTSILNNDKIKALIAAGGGVFFEDYTTRQRIGMGALNIFGGAGSLMNGHKIGGLTTGFEVVGIAFVIGGIATDPAMSIRDGHGSMQDVFIFGGITLIGTGVVFGFIIPFFHHKPNNTRVSQNNFPFNLELVSSNNQEVNGLRVSYNVKF